MLGGEALLELLSFKKSRVQQLQRGMELDLNIQNRDQLTHGNCRNNLQEVYEIAKSVADNLATIGASLDRCHVPGRTTNLENDTVGDAELEYGMGNSNNRFLSLQYTLLIIYRNSQ